MEIVYLFIMLLTVSGAQYLGGWLVLKGTAWVKNSQEFFLALSAGFLLSLALVNLIPESLELSASAPLYVIVGFGLLHLLEHSFIHHLHFGEENHRFELKKFSFVLPTFAGLFIHTIFDGITLAAVFLHDWALGILAFLGLILHKLPEGLTIASVTQAAGMSKTAGHRVVLALATGSFLGLAIVYFLDSVNPEVSGGLLAFSAGIALYICTADLIPEVNKSKNKLVPVTLFAGMFLYWIMTALFHAH